MSNETEKPLAGVLRAVNILDGPHEEDEGVCECTLCRISANIIARESGLAKLVEAVEEMERADFSNLRERSTASLVTLIDAQRKVIAAARRVREG